MRIPVGYGQINFRFSGVVLPNGAEVTVGFRNNLTGTPDAIGAIVLGHWTTNLKSIQASQVVNHEILVKLGPNDTGASAIVAGGGAGSRGSGVVAPQAACLVKKTTLLGGRHGRGRLYWPGILRDEAGGDGVISSGTLDDITDAWNGFSDDMDSDLLPLYLLHGDATAPTLISSFAAVSPLATQRRRMRD